ncbi:MAG: flagellar basal body P-ring formation chaperone FlgA, partial [Pseudomonadota bacterium]|nr:flagellar basal body P-ring formation chaperone FlgA [Pseudomonadota bacterium]
MQKFRIVHFFIGLVIVTGQPINALAAGAATQWQGHAAIRSTAQSFMDAFVSSQHQGRSTVKLGQLDSRLRLKTCSSPLEAFMPSGGRVMGNTTVGVRCLDDGGWNIYISARVDVFGPVLIARQPLARGTSIQDNDLERVERNLANLPYGYYTDSQPIAGMLAKRTIASATVITPQMLQAPKLIKRGQRVTVIAESGPLSIRSVGKALSDGKSGDTIRVKAEGSQRVVDG